MANKISFRPGRPAVMIRMLMKVLNAACLYNPGEIAAFEPTAAERIVARGGAQFVEPTEPYREVTKPIVFTPQEPFIEEIPEVKLTAEDIGSSVARAVIAELDARGFLKRPQ